MIIKMDIKNIFKTKKKPIEFTREQYRDLLLSVLVGTYIRESAAELQGKSIKKIGDLEKYLLSLAKEFDSEDMVENFKGHLIPNDKVCKEYHDDIIEEHDNEQFWHRLTVDLGKRDFWKTVTKEEKEKIEKDDWLPERVNKFYEWYEKEFAENGIENLKVVRNSH